MARGERPPMKKRRPAPGAYGPDYAGPRPPGVPEEPAPELRALEWLTPPRALRTGRAERRSGTRDQIVRNAMGFSRASTRRTSRVETKEVEHMSSGQDASNAGGRSARELAEQVRFLESEVADLRRRLSDSATAARGLELRLADTQRSLSAVTAQNERLAQTLREAREQIMK